MNPKPDTPPRRAAHLAPQKSLRRDLRRQLTPAEATLWRMLKTLRPGNRQWRRLFSVDCYVLDFYCPTLRLCVELDGAPHFTPEGAEHDQQRTDYLRQQRIRVIRFENRFIFEQADRVLAGIEQAMKEQEEYLKGGTDAHGGTHAAGGTHSSVAYGATSPNLGEEPEILPQQTIT